MDNIILGWVRSSGAHASFPIEVSSDGSAMAVSDEQDRNAPMPIKVIDAGSVIDLSSWQKLKA